MNSQDTLLFFYLSFLLINVINMITMGLLFGNTNDGFK